jgi:hypothetical protein
MDVSSIKKYLTPYKVYGRGSTSVTYAFAAAIVERDAYDCVRATAAIRLLDQDIEDLSCVYCDARADRWDHLLPLVREGRQFGPGHRIRNLVPCCSRCNGAKGNKDFVGWLPGWISDGAARVRRLRAYLAQNADNPATPLDSVGGVEAALAEYWRIREMIFHLMRDADVVAAHIHALRDEAERPRLSAPEPSIPPPRPTDGPYPRPRPRRRGIGTLAMELLAQGFQDDAILAEIRCQFPDARTTKGCLAWYRCKMKNSRRRQYSLADPAPITGLGHPYLRRHAGISQTPR